MGRVARREKRDGRQRRRKKGGEEKCLKGFLRCDLLVSFHALDRMSLLSSSGRGLGPLTSLGSITLDGRQIPGVVSGEFETTVTHDSEINKDKEKRGRGGTEKEKKDTK